MTSGKIIADGNIWHDLHHLWRDTALLLRSLRLSCGIRKHCPAGDFCGITLRPGKAADLQEIRNLFAAERQLPPPWILRLWRLRPGSLLTVAADHGRPVACLGYIFNPGDTPGVIFEAGATVAREYTGRGLAAALRRYARGSFQPARISGISLLVRPGDIRAMRAAQHAGFAITKMAAKPQAYYLYAATTAAGTP